MTPIIAIARLQVHVSGTPAPQGSKRYLGRGILVESSKRVRPWREAVRDAAERAMAVPYPFDRAPLKVSLGFVLARPKSHYRTGAHDHELRTNAPLYVATRPDLDKLTRSTLDALTAAAVWYDDAQVCSLYCSKTYASGSAPGVDIIVEAV